VENGGSNEIKIRLEEIVVEDVLSEFESRSVEPGVSRSGISSTQRPSLRWSNRQPSLAKLRDVYLCSFQRRDMTIYRKPRESTCAPFRDVASRETCSFGRLSLAASEMPFSGGKTLQRASECTLRSSQASLASRGIGTYVPSEDPPWLPGDVPSTWR